MKQILFLLLTISAFSCTKEHDDSIKGQWKFVESVDDTGQIYRLPTSEAAFIEFKSNGEFKVVDNTTTNYNQVLKGFNRYKVESAEVIKFYNTDNSDSETLEYLFHEGSLNISFHYAYNRFAR